MIMDIGKSCPRIPRRQTLLSFCALAVIRGSFAVLIHYGIASYKTPSLLFLLRTPGTVILFLLSVLFLAWQDEEIKLEIWNNLKSLRAYKRAAILGFFQLCGPYMLFMYSLKFLNPTAGAVFMAGTPWFTSVLERVLSPQIRTGGQNWTTIGSVIGAFGMVLVSVASLCLITTDTSCKAMYGFHNITTNTSNISHGYIINVTTKKVLLRDNTCLTSLEISTAYIALCGATVLWSVSAVFSKLKRVHQHFLVGGLLNNVFGGLYAAILWLVVEQHINTNKVVWTNLDGSLSVVFLSVASSWAASLILYYLVRNIGAEPTNRVMFLVPLVTWLEELLLLKRITFLWIFILEAIGVLFVIIGLYLSTIMQAQSQAHDPLLPESEDDDDDGVTGVNEMSDMVQSEEELMESGTSSMQDSVEPPIVHYVDDDEDEGEVW